MTNQVLNYAEQADSSGDNVYNFGGTVKKNGTSVTATGAEINKLDLSAETETVTAAGAASVTKKITNLELSGSGAVTLAAPDATMLGVVKVIEMTVDNGDVTLALTNVQGGSAATTATFDAVGEQLVLVGGSAKWTVIGEGGVTLS